MKMALVIGNLNTDLVCYPVDALPAWGEERTCEVMFSRPAGSAGYAALALGKLGLSPVVLGNVGSDPNGRAILDALAQAGADTSNIRVVEGVPTGVSVAMVNRRGERAFVTHCGHLVDLDADVIVGAIRSVPEVGYALLAGYLLLPGIGPAGALRILRACRERGGTTLLDTGCDPMGWRPETVREVRDVLREVDVFLPNDEEAAAVAGISGAEDAARRLLTLGPHTVVVKRGDQGSLFASRSLGLVREPAIKVSVLDTTGAGDAFNAGLVFALSRRWGPHETLRFASAVAALTVSRNEPRFPMVSEALGLLKTQGT